MARGDIIMVNVPFLDMLAIAYPRSGSLGRVRRWLVAGGLQEAGQYCFGSETGLQ